MGFVLSLYQGLSEPLYQTIFLDKQRNGTTWSSPEIDHTKMVSTWEWHQFIHDGHHLTNVVANVKRIQSSSTLFCGSWTLINTHECAVISGLACAVRLGAVYPFGDDELALEQFRTQYLLSHGRSV
jgi:hypothetical protein